MCRKADCKVKKMDVTVHCADHRTELSASVVGCADAGEEAANAAFSAAPERDKAGLGERKPSLVATRESPGRIMRPSACTSGSSTCFALALGVEPK